MGRHNPVKPPETERVKEKPMAVGDVRHTHTQADISLWFTIPVLPV